MRSTYMFTGKGCNRNCAAGVWKSLWAGVLILGLGSTFAFGGVPQACPADAASPAGCTSNGSGAGIDTLTTSAQHGDKVCFTVAIFNTCSTCCDVAGVDTTLFIGDPDGPGGSAAATSYPITSGAYLERGADFICPSADLRCVTAGNCTIPGQIGYEYIVAHANEHGETGDSCPPDPAAGTGQVSAYAQGAGTLCRAIPVGASLCKALAIDIPHGACCDPCTGDCVDGVGASECVAPDTFSLGMTCAQVNCTPADCDDNDACTADSCNATTGLCEHGPRTVCTDNDVCTEDSCNPATGQCEYGPRRVCTDNDACTTDTCDPRSGCVYTPVSCDDNNPCTTDTCDSATGSCTSTPTEPPPPGCAEFAGCTPGFWKQPQHLQYWAVYLPTDLYEIVFGVDAHFAATTLLQVLGQGGGGEIALGRHAVAALLNSTNDEVDYAYSTAEVISMVQSAYATGDYSTAHGLLARENERGCTVDKSGDERLNPKPGKSGSRGR